jgi:antirestriction protein
MLRMELSWVVKGYLADLIARESLGRIKIIGMRVGIEPGTIESLNEPRVILDDEHDPYEGMSSNEKAALYIIKNTDNQDLLIETVLDMAKKGVGGKWFNRIYPELNSIMERTMQCRIGAEWNIIPILDENLQTSEKETFIEKKLEEFGFNETLANYKEALKTYKTSYKGSIALLRSTFESLVDDIMESKGEPLKSNQKAKLAQLEKQGILKEIDTQQCQKCQYKKKDSEFNYSYDIYSLLSHYGSHKELLTEELANFLFTSTLGFVWFLINRYENVETK